MKDSPLKKGMCEKITKLQKNHHPASNYLGTNKLLQFM